MRLTLVLGGARSGKSSFAKKLMEGYKGPVTFATARAKDEEMKRRISLHKKERLRHRDTWEGNPGDLIEHLNAVKGAALLDCLTTWLSEFMFDRCDMENLSEDDWCEVQGELLSNVEMLCKTKGPELLVVVSNEIGNGVVPASLMGRRFRDLQGRANQITALYADDVVMMIAGLPLWLKEECHLAKIGKLLKALVAGDLRAYCKAIY